MCDVLKYRKILLNVSLRLRFGCVYFFNLLKTSTVPIVFLPDAWHIGGELGGNSEIKVSHKSKLTGPFNRGDTIINNNVTFYIQDVTHALLYRDNCF